MTQGDRVMVVRLQEGLRFVAITPSGFEIAMDSRIEPGERVSAPNPMEMQLAALGGCGAMDTISVLRKMRQEITAYEVRLTYRRAPEHPKVYTAVELVHAVRGRGVSEASVRRAVQLTMIRYCPAYAMLHPTIDITERYEITDEATGAVVSGPVTARDDGPEGNPSPAD